jgi:hypothetical protein
MHLEDLQATLLVRHVNSHLWTGGVCVCGGGGEPAEVSEVGSYSVGGWCIEGLQGMGYTGCMPCRPRGEVATAHTCHKSTVVGDTGQTKHSTAQHATAQRPPDGQSDQGAAVQGPGCQPCWWQQSQ